VIDDGSAAKAVLRTSFMRQGAVFQIWDFAVEQQRETKSQIERVQAQPAAPRVVVPVALPLTSRTRCSG